MQVEILTALLLLGFTLGAVPAQTVAGVMVASLGQRLGVSPEQVEAYRNATAIENTDDEGN